MAGQALPLALGKVGKVGGVGPASGGAELGIRFQPFGSVFPDRFQHQQPGLSGVLIHLPDQAFVHQGSQSIENVHPRLVQALDLAGHRFDRLERAAADEHREQLKQALLAAVEQLIAPVNGVAQRLLPDRQVARPTPQQFQPAPQPFEQRLR